jgi:hypothetical protein
MVLHCKLEWDGRYCDYEVQFLAGVSGLNRLCEIVLVSFLLEVKALTALQ